MSESVEEQIRDLLLWRDPDTRDLLEAIAKKHKINTDAIIELLAWNRQVQRKGDKYGGLKKELDEILSNQILWKS